MTSSSENKPYREALAAAFLPRTSSSVFELLAHAASPKTLSFLTLDDAPAGLTARPISKLFLLTLVVLRSTTPLLSCTVLFVVFVNQPVHQCSRGHPDSTHGQRSAAQCGIEKPSGPQADALSSRACGHDCSSHGTTSNFERTPRVQQHASVPAQPCPTASLSRTGVAAADKRSLVRFVPWPIRQHRGVVQGDLRAIRGATVHLGKHRKRTNYGDGRKHILSI